MLPLKKVKCPCHGTKAQYYPTLLYLLSHIPAPKQQRLYIPLIFFLLVVLINICINFKNNGKIFHSKAPL